MKNTKMLLLVMLIAAVVAAVARFWDVISLFLIAAVLAYVLNPLANLLCRKTHMRRGFAVFLAILLFLLLLVLTVSLIAPAAVRQISNLVGYIQRYGNTFNELIDSLVEHLQHLNLPQPVAETLVNLLRQSDSYIASFFTSILTSLLSFSLRLFDALIVVILLFYFLLDGPKLLRAFIGVLPPALGRRAARMTHETNQLTWRYIRARIIMSAGMAAVTFVGLTLIGMPYAPLFAVLSFIMDFIPYFGSIIAGVLEAFVALLTGGLPMAIAVAIFVLVVQQVEGNVVAPKMQGDATGMHPLTVLFALLACNAIWGPFGMLISVPIAVAVKILIKEVYFYIISPDGLEDAPYPAYTCDPDQLVLEGFLPEAEEAPAPPRKRAAALLSKLRSRGKSRK